MEDGEKVKALAQEYKVPYGHIKHLYKKHINNTLNF